MRKTGEKEEQHVLRTNIDEECEMEVIGRKREEKKDEVYVRKF